MSDKSLHIASATNAQYLPHLATLVESLAASNSLERATLHLLHDDSVGADLQAQLKVACDRHGLTLRFVHPEAGAIKGVPSAGGIPPIIWYRIWLPELLDPLDRILYLDADTLVLQDLLPLWNVDLGDMLLAAVPQPTEMGGTERLTTLGYPAPHTYFNSGVMLMNLDLMRNEGLSQRLASLGHELSEDKRHPDWVRANFPYPDQDAYNLACQARWMLLHPRWNCFASLFLSVNSEAHAGRDIAYTEALASPAILHFEGSIFAKPWNYRCVHPHRDLYLNYRRRTSWPLRALEGSGAKEKLLNILPVRQQLKLGGLKRRVTERIARST